MRVVSFDDFTAASKDENGRIRMAMGVFDGIHLGHQQLLRNLGRSGSEGESRFVFTFRNNPKMVLGRKGFDKNIITLTQKLNLLSEYNIDQVVLIDFSYEFSKLHGEEFFTMITNACDLRYIVIGENFSCGYRAAFTSGRIRQWFSDSETAVDVVPFVCSEGERVSSSLIRKDILHHRMEDAARMLGRVFSIDTADIPQRVGEKTIEIDREHIVQILPPPGLYDAEFLFSGSLREEGTLYIRRGTLECYCEGAAVNGVLQELFVRKKLN